MGKRGMFWGEHEGHEEPRRDTKDAPEKLGSLEVWRLGGATEGEARATAFGGDEAEHCAAITRDTKDCQNGKRRLFRRFARKTLRYLTDFCRFGACWRTQGGGFAVSYNAFSVARLPRGLFTVFCSLFSRARQRPPVLQGRSNEECKCFCAGVGVRLEMAGMRRSCRRGGGSG